MYREAPGIKRSLLSWNLWSGGKDRGDVELMVKLSIGDALVVNRKVVDESD